jgi:OOP family OmpA-OmpF porin
MKSLRYAGALAAMLFLAACGTPVDQLNNTQIAGGSAFTQRLAQEYRDLANFEASRMADYTDAYYFAQKGLAAAAGNPVPPADLSEFDIPAEWQGIAADARARLVAALDGNARTTDPENAAIAQVKFDCWLENLEERVQFDQIAACHDEYAAAVEVVPPAPSEAVYFVFFDWDRSDITPAAQSVLDRVAQDFFAGQFAGIDVDGHADRSGSDQYNIGLGQRRANAVAAALVARGVPAGVIATQTFGERVPLVETPDGVREPSNRRAEIRFQ